MAFSLSRRRPIWSEVDLEAKYVPRCRAGKRELLLAITGKASEPTLEFTLDGQAIEKGDAVSYMLFGKSLDELGGVKSAAGETGLLVGLASQQLSATLGEATGLDMIEIRGQSLSQGTVAVGKYLTNDLFLSYEQQYGNKDASTSSTSSTSIVTLEYELLKLLRFKLISGDPKKTGVDVFLKFEK
jgi:translocation and assembly module TamB